MTTQDESNDPQTRAPNANARESTGGRRRLFLLLGLLALALFALAYDYKVARPAVETAYDLVTVANDEINNASEHRRMTNADVQAALKRSPSDTFTKGTYTIEAYRWSAGLPIEFRGLKGEESPGIGLKTHDYYAVYRKDGSDLAFVTHFKIRLDEDYFAEPKFVQADDDGDSDEGMPPGMGDDVDVDSGNDPGADGPGGGGPGGPGGPGGGGFDPEAIFAERDLDGDGKLTGEEISERMREGLEATDADGDGAVSKEEFMARMSQIRGRRGSGGPGGGGPGRGGPGGEAPGGEGPERQQRPPLESSDDAPAAAATSSDAPPAAESKEAPAVPATDPAPEAADATEKEEGGSES